MIDMRKNENPKVSIIIPVFNAEKYVRTTIESILDQSISDWELLLIDDCSKDNTPIICQDLSQIDERIVYIRQTENGGPAKARNIGVDQAKGEYLTFVDSDDTVAPDFLEKLVVTAENTGADIVWCNYKEISNDRVIYREHKLPCCTSISYDTYIRLFLKNKEGLGSLWNKLYRRGFIEKNQIRLNSKRVHGEDWEFNLMCFRSHPVLVAIEDALYNYIRQNNSSVMATYHVLDFQNLVGKYQLLEELAQEENYRYDKNEMINRFIYNVINLLVLLKRSKIDNKEEEFKKIVDNDFFQNILKSECNVVKMLPIRYKLYFFLIKFRLTGLAYIVM